MSFLIFAIVAVAKIFTSILANKDTGCACGIGQPGPVSGKDPDQLPELPTVRKIAQGYLPHSRPWMAYLLMMNRETEIPTVCGGAILNRKFIITAAHCFCSSKLCMEVENEQDKKSYHKIDSDLNMTDFVRILFKGQASHQRAKESPIRVDQVIIHPHYDRIYNDLALVKLTIPLNFNESDLMPICLPPSPNFNGSVEKGVVAGWGSIRDPFCTTNGQSPDKFHRCKFPFKFNNEDVDEDMIFDSCTFAPPPGHKNPVCKNFYNGLEHRKPFPRFPVEIHVDKELPVVCYNNTHGIYGWCGTMSQAEMIETPENTTGFGRSLTHAANNHWVSERVMAVGGRKISASTGWGWCQAHCQLEVEDQEDNKENKLKAKPQMDHRLGDRDTIAQSNLNEAELNILNEAECLKYGEYVDALSKLVLKVNFTSELCAGKLTVEESPQRWIGKVETSDKNQTSYNFTFDAEKPADNKQKHFYGGRDACRGDSGGPIWIWDGSHQNKKAVLIGVVSRGKGCALYNVAGVYTRIKVFLDWIHEHIEPGNCPVNAH